MRSLLKLQPLSAAPFSYRTDPTMILVSTPVKDDLCNPLLFGPSSQSYTHHPGLLRLVETRDLIPDLLVQG